ALAGVIDKHHGGDGDAAEDVEGEKSLGDGGGRRRSHDIRERRAMSDGNQRRGFLKGHVWMPRAIWYQYVAWASRPCVIAAWARRPCYESVSTAFGTHKTSTAPQTNAPATTSNPPANEPVWVFAQPMAEGATKPARAPMELTMAIPPAAAVPRR